MARNTIASIALSFQSDLTQLLTLEQSIHAHVAAQYLLWWLLCLYLQIALVLFIVGTVEQKTFLGSSTHCSYLNHVLYKYDGFSTSILIALTSITVGLYIS